tara:strand:- start:177 stop:284 length:108 start_codon:yes stop_codon:yes gene_type:complete
MSPSVTRNDLREGQSVHLNDAVCVVKDGEEDDREG